MKQVWYVLGEPDVQQGWNPTLFATKTAAEMYARQLWPLENPDTRYARVLYRSVWTEADMAAHEQATSK